MTNTILKKMDNGLAFSKIRVVIAHTDKQTDTRDQV